MVVVETYLVVAVELCLLVCSCDVVLVVAVAMCVPVVVPIVLVVPPVVRRDLLFFCTGLPNQAFPTSNCRKGVE